MSSPKNKTGMRMKLGRNNPEGRRTVTGVVSCGWSGGQRKLCDGTTTDGKKCNDRAQCVFTR